MKVTYSEGSLTLTARSVRMTGIVGWPHLHRQEKRFPRRLGLEELPRKITGGFRLKHGFLYHFGRIPKVGRGKVSMMTLVGSPKFKSLAAWSGRHKSRFPHPAIKVPLPDKSRAVTLGLQNLGEGDEFLP